MKNEYKKAALEILPFNAEDIIVTSGEGNNETPKMPWSPSGAASPDIDEGAAKYSGY